MNLSDAGDVLWVKKLAERRLSDVDKVLLSKGEMKDAGESADKSAD